MTHPSLLTVTISQMAMMVIQTLSPSLNGLQSSNSRSRQGGTYPRRWRPWPWRLVSDLLFFPINLTPFSVAADLAHFYPYGRLGKNPFQTFQAQGDDAAIPQVVNGGPSNHTAVPEQPEPVWPIETNLIFFPGTTKVLLMLQKPLMCLVIQDSFEQV